jgi:hypothetical protein
MENDHGGVKEEISVPDYAFILCISNKEHIRCKISIL